MHELDNSEGWAEWSKYVLKEIEKLGDNFENIVEEIGKINIEFAKISNLKHTFNDFKDWKKTIDEIVNVTDLQKIKDFYLDHKDIKNTIANLKETLAKYDKEIEDYKKFKTKVYAIGGVLSFLLVTSLSIAKFFF